MSILTGWFPLKEHVTHLRCLDIIGESSLSACKVFCFCRRPSHHRKLLRYGQLPVINVPFLETIAWVRLSVHFAE